RFIAIGDHDELITCLWQAFHAENFDGSGGRGLFELRAAIIEHGSDLAIDVPHDEVIAGVQRPVLHEHGSYRATTSIEFRFENDTAGNPFRSCLEFLKISDEADH